MPEDSVSTPIDWSYTNSCEYETCQRAFYYQQRYFHNADSKSAEETFESTLAVQETPGSLIGSAVHRSISHQIDLWKQGCQMNMTTAQKNATDMICEYAESYSLSSLNSKKETNGIKQDLISAVESHLQTFFRVIWPQFSTHRYITHEKLASFFVDGHQAWIRPDLCTRNKKGRFVVTDWKTSSPNPFTEPSHQLLVYAYWVYQHYEPDLDRIRVQQVHTGTGEFDRMSVNSQQLDGLVERIVTECEEWNSRSDKAQFPPDPKANKCSRCRHIDRCEAGQMARISNEE